MHEEIIVFPHITNYVFVTNLATCPPPAVFLLMHPFIGFLILLCLSCLLLLTSAIALPQAPHHLHGNCWLALKARE